MLEIWSTSQDFRVKSLAHCFPAAPVPSGRKLVISDIVVRRMTSAAPNSRPGTQGGGGQAAGTRPGTQGGSKPGTGDDAMGVRDAMGFTTEVERYGEGSSIGDTGSIASIGSHDSIAHSFKREAFILGIRYMNIEQCLHMQVVEQVGGLQFTSTTPLELMVSNERDIYVTLYEVDKTLAVGEEESGKMQKKGNA